MGAALPALLSLGNDGDHVAARITSVQSCAVMRSANAYGASSTQDLIVWMSASLADTHHAVWNPGAARSSANEPNVSTRECCFEAHSKELTRLKCTPASSASDGTASNSASVSSATRYVPRAHCSLSSMSTRASKSFCVYTLPVTLTGAQSKTNASVDSSLAAQAESAAGVIFHPSLAEPLDMVSKGSPSAAANTGSTGLPPAGAPIRGRFPPCAMVRACAMC
mmetsp:Transcript_14492/g.38750  ORF Transcript_14492/g.38750 Transcript_14492/m.38750 type:complete len:223 (-) Transcript_14492:1341-2009(-)